jgi:uncharacterized membrane protein
MQDPAAMIGLRMKIRRRIALSSFLSVILLVVASIFFILTATPEMRLNLQAVSPLLVTLVVCLVGLVTHYMTNAYFDDKHISKGKDFEQN